jgi:hypothetical protein
MILIGITSCHCYHKTIWKGYVPVSYFMYFSGIDYWEIDDIEEPQNDSLVEKNRPQWWKNKRRCEIERFVGKPAIMKKEEIYIDNKKVLALTYTYYVCADRTFIYSKQECVKSRVINVFFSKDKVVKVSVGII